MNPVKPSATSCEPWRSSRLRTTSSAWNSHFQSPYSANCGKVTATVYIPSKASRVPCTRGLQSPDDLRDYANRARVGAARGTQGGLPPRRAADDRDREGLQARPPARCGPTGRPRGARAGRVDRHRHGGRRGRCHHSRHPGVRPSSRPDALARYLGGYSFGHRFADPPEDDVHTTTGRRRL